MSTAPNKHPRRTKMSRRAPRSAPYELREGSADDTLDTLINTALSLGAAELRLAQWGSRVRLMARLDGRFVELVPGSLGPAALRGLVAAIKKRARLEAHVARPQGGAFMVAPVGKEPQVVRAQILPGLWGDQAELRFSCPGTV
jgi:type II secretory ATPase GspE/PulE/Tfp pilus assembly ATPase PilB-like protein